MKNKPCSGAQTQLSDLCFIWLHIIPHCLLSEACLKWPTIFSVIALRSGRVSFNKFLRLKLVNLHGEADTRLCVHKAGGLSSKTPSIYLSGSWQRTELTSNGFPQQNRGGAFFFSSTVLTCPVYAQRLMLFANHSLWKFTSGARHAMLGFCQLPS